MRAPKIDWPPLVTGTRLPLWVRVRDFALTLLAWAALAYLLRDAIALLVDYLSAPLFELTHAQPPQWREIGRHMRPFLSLAGMLVCWLAIWSLLRRKRMRAVPPSPQPAPLPDAEHAVAFGVDPLELDAWREHRIVVVNFDAGDRISGVTQVAVPGTAVAGGDAMSV
jgi:poly-beta-1,6-N-acetyl-D-glucosamine biosynthesis protein PgaD